MNRIVVYTKPNCSYCVQAKGLLNMKAIPFQEIHIGTDITRDQLVEQFPDARTAPVITVDGSYIGGFNELRTIVEGTQELLLG